MADCTAQVFPLTRSLHHVKVFTAGMTAVFIRIVT